MKVFRVLTFGFLIFLVQVHPSSQSSESAPRQYSELNDYVIPSPSQGETDACLYMATTGAMEILLNQKLGLKNAKVNGATDLSETYAIHADENEDEDKTWFENAFLNFNSGEAALAKDMPFDAYTEDGDENDAVWSAPENFYLAPRISLPKVDTVFLFSAGSEFDRGVLNESHVEMVKRALVQYRSPILALGNDDDYWHLVVITGYDDDATDGLCYELPASVCANQKGAFYVRDSFGRGVEKRSYQWFIRRENSAAVAKLAGRR